jgi:hypothetical protein
MTCCRTYWTPALTTWWPFASRWSARYFIRPSFLFYAYSASHVFLAIQVAIQQGASNFQWTAGVERTPLVAPSVGAERARPFAPLPYRQFAPTQDLYLVKDLLRKGTVRLEDSSQEVQYAVKRGWHDMVGSLWHIRTLGSTTSCNVILISHEWGVRQVRTLLDTGVPMPQTPDLFDNAILRDDLPMIKLLLKYNASPTSQTLQTVLRAKRDDILLLLLQAGLSPNQKWSIARPNLKIIGSVGWWTPLHQVQMLPTWQNFVVIIFHRR